MTDCSREYVDRRIGELEKLVNAWRDADERARKLALDGLEHRLEGMNEFREEMGAQRDTFLPRESGELRLRSLENAYQRLAGAISLIGIILTVVSVAAIVIGIVR